jgi:hypothetical protein
MNASSLGPWYLSLHLIYGKPTLTTKTIFCMACDAQYGSHSRQHNEKKLLALQPHLQLRMAMTRTMNGEKSNSQIRAISMNPACRFAIVKDCQRKINFLYLAPLKIEKPSYHDTDCHRHRINLRNKRKRKNAVRTVIQRKEH